MLLKNVASQGVYLYEYAIATGLPNPGDSANITGYWSLDGGTATVFGTTNPTELSATHMPGVYWQPLAQGETNGNAIAYSWKSSTSGVAIDPLVVFTTGVSIPVAAPGAAGGSFIAGTNAATTVTTSFTTTFTGSLTGSVASVTGAVGSVTAIVSANITQVLGTASAGAVGYVGVDWGAVANKTTANALTGTTIAATQVVATVTNQLTAAAIATGVWQDTTAGDFTTASSIGKSLYNIFTVAGGSVLTTASLVNAPTGGSAPTAAAIATAVWQDATTGDFTTASSIGKSLYNLVTVAGGSVLTTASLVNAPTGGSAPTAAAIATAVWEDTTAGGDFGTAGSIGKLIATTGITIAGYTGNTPQTGDSFARLGVPSGASIDADILSRLATSSYTVPPTAAAIGAVVAAGSVASVTGAVGSVTAGVNLNLSQSLNAARAVDAIADTSLTLNDALQLAVASVSAQVDASSGTSCVFKTASTGTTLRTKTLTLVSTPSTVPDKAI